MRITYFERTIRGRRSADAGVVDQRHVDASPLIDHGAASAFGDDLERRLARIALLVINRLRENLECVGAIDRSENSGEAVVKANVLDSGIMHACVRKNVDFCLLGSVRDEGPLPESITDTVLAQDHIREAIRDVGFVLMVATRTLSIATAYILPAATPVVCVDLNPAVLNRIRDRGTFQTIGIVTDAESFFRELLEEVQKLQARRAGKSG